MVELFPEGFEEVEHADGIELAAYTNSGGEERLWHVFGPGREDRIPPDWESAWKRFHHPVRIGPLWIGPPWEPAPSDASAVVIDPGRAFGTGSHPTTRLCVELLLECDRGSLTDVGCGSGILAIAAARLGFAPVVALDADADAVAAARANAAANGVDVDVRQADALTTPLPAASLTVANITLAAVERIAAGVASPLLVTSGYLASEGPRAAGWTQRARREAGGWAADLFERH